MAGSGQQRAAAVRGCLHRDPARPGWHFERKGLWEIKKWGLGGWGSDQRVERFLGELKGRGRDTFTPSAVLPNDKAASRTPEAPLDAPVTSTLEAHESHLGSVENIHPSVQ